MDMQNPIAQREKCIEELQDDVLAGRIINLDELKEACSKRSYGIDPYEDVLLPMGYNTCDRCKELCDSELDLFWLDFDVLNEDDPDDERMLKRLGEELKQGKDYTAICYECVKELRGK